MRHPVSIHSRGESRSAQRAGCPMSRALPHDPALPKLAQALDPHAMMQVFGAVLDGLQVQACEVDRVKYRPGRNCTVAYRLRLFDAQQDRAFEQRVAARFCSGGDSARRYRNALGRSTAASAAGPALIHVPALDMLAHWWPNDAKLDALQLLHDGAALRRRCLGEVVAALTGGRGLLVDHQMTVAQAVPELRVCARVELRLQREPGAAVSSHTLYAKADLERSGAATHAVMLALSESPAQAGGRLRTPQPLLWQQAAGLHWQLGVPGRPLQDMDPQIGAAASARVGARLAALHATPVRAAQVISTATLRAQVCQAAELLASVEPAWSPRLARLAQRLDAGAGALASQPMVTLHGDLHPRNILVDGQEYAFIDLDGVHAGPAAIELGGWVADTLYRALLDGEPAQRVAPSWRAFLAAYAEASNQTLDPSLLAWSTAYHLLCRRTYRCVANLKPGRFEAVPALLALANAIADAGSVDAACPRALEPV